MEDYILVVDDEPDVRELFKITLSMAGYKIVVAEDGEKALKVIENEVPRLIVLDLMMPRLDGYGVLDSLRANRPSDDLKVLIATAKTIDETDQERLETWPVVGVLNKGELDIAKMVIRVKGILAANAASPKPAAAPSSAAAKPIAKPAAPLSAAVKPTTKPAAPLSGGAKPTTKPAAPSSDETKSPAKPAAPSSDETRSPAKPAASPPDGTKPLIKPATPSSGETRPPAKPATPPPDGTKPLTKPAIAPSERARPEPKSEE